MNLAYHFVREVTAYFTGC